MTRYILPVILVYSMCFLSGSIVEHHILQTTLDTLQYPEEKHFKNLRQLTFGGDNAEAYFSFDGKYLVFQKTNPNEGIMCDQIWMGKLPTRADEPFRPKLVSTGTGRTTCSFFYPDGKHVKRITNTLGYDGGGWFSPDGKKIVWRASRPKTLAEIADYKDLLSKNQVAPTSMEVWIANADGSDAHQVTFLEKANWAPNFLPDGKHIIFCSNHEYKRGYPFNMYITGIDGKGLEKISHDKGFDAFPMFSNDGNKIAFSSNRNNGGTRDTNIFIADWVE